MRDDIVRNVEQGRALTAQQLVDAQAARTAIYRRTCALMERYDLLAAPVAPVVPPPVEVPWVAEVAGVRFERYFEWQRCATRIVATAHPALSLPGGFSREGLPVGLQLVGRHRGELELLRHAAAIEAATGHGLRRPPAPRDCVIRAARCDGRAAICDRRAVIETVLGPLDAGAAGRDVDARAPAVRRSRARARAAARARPGRRRRSSPPSWPTRGVPGLGAVVDLTVWGFGGPSPRLPQLARDSGVHVIAGVGAYLGRTWPDWLRALDGDALTERFVAALTDHLPGCDHRAGIVGLVGEGIPPAPEEERAVRAAGAAAAATGTRRRAAPRPARRPRRPAARPARRGRHRAQASRRPPGCSSCSRARASRPSGCCCRTSTATRRTTPACATLAATGATLKWCFGYDAPPRAGLTAATDAQRLDAICMLLEHAPGARQTLACGTWTRGALRAHGGRGFAHLPRADRARPARARPRRRRAGRAAASPRRGGCWTTAPPPPPQETR